MQTLGTYSSTSNSQNENSLYIGLFGGVRVGAAGHVGGTRGFKMYGIYTVLGTQSSQNGHFRYLFLNFQFSELEFIRFVAFCGVPDKCCWPRWKHPWLQKSGFTMLWAPRALKSQTLGTYSSISNSQNENSLDLELLGGFRIGVAGHACGTRGFKK